VYRKILYRKKNRHEKKKQSKKRQKKIDRDRNTYKIFSRFKLQHFWSQIMSKFT